LPDIFISYHSSDRPRAEALRSWFQELGWSVWIDRDIDLSEGWEERITDELAAARLVVVLWGAQARRSAWVQREAKAALDGGRLLQIHATGLPLLPPFDSVQAVRMQSWSGEALHSERKRLLAAVAQRLGAAQSVLEKIEPVSEALPDLHFDVTAALELAFHYCARQLESRRHALAREPQEQDWEEIRRAFSALIAQLHINDASSSDDREGILHMMVNDFLTQLELLAPHPGTIT
jgi:hypothetical protein